MRRPLGLVYLLFCAASCSGETGVSAPDGPSSGPDAAPDGPDAALGAPDAALGGPDGGGGGLDAAPGTADGVRCGDMTCTPGLACCLREVGPTVVPMCQDMTAACQPGLLYRCDGPEDCEGGDCCETTTGSSCVPAGTCPDRRLCNSPGDCETGEMCCPPSGPSTPFTYDRCVGTLACPR
jgi:hypothetical protein